MSEYEDPDFYSREEARARLGISETRLDRLALAGLLPYCRRKRGARLFDATHITSLANVLQLGTGHNYPAYDIDIVRLWHLRHQYYECAPDTHGARKWHRQKVQKSCAELIETGRVVRLDAFCDMMKDLVTADVMGVWACSDRIITVKLGMSRFTSRAYAKHLHKIFLTWPTVFDAAARLGISRSALDLRRPAEFFTSLVTPDGKLRLDPSEVEAFKAAPVEPGLLRVGSAAARLGVVRHTLAGAMERGDVESVIVNGIPYVPEHSVAYWEEKFSAINPGFTWLDHQNRVLNGMKLITPKHAMRLLAVNYASSSKWFAENLLPYYVCNFALHKQIPERYIKGLQQFAQSNSLPIGGATLLDYRELCAEEQMIV